VASWLTSVALLIETGGFGTRETTLFVGRLPNDPDNLVAILPYAGRTPDRTHDGNERRYPRMQINVRNDDPGTAWDKAENIRNLLRDFLQSAVDGIEFETIEPLSEPFIMPHDTDRRTVVTCNYEVRWQRNSTL
jgi:hypothetical protein